MKKLLILILFFYSNFNLLNAQWVECNKCSECLNGSINIDAVWCFAIDENNTYTGIKGGVFMTTDYGAHWTAKNNGLISVINERNILSLAIDGNNIFAGTMIDGIFLSTDKGENWERKSNGLPTPKYVDTIYKTVIFNLKIIGNNIYAGTNIGVYITTDYGEKWIPKNEDLLQIDSFNIVTSITNIGNNIFAGTKHGVYMTTDNGDNWFPKNNGIGNIETWSLEVNGNNIYAGAGGNLFLSTDNGDNWNKIKDSIATKEIKINGNNIFVGGYGIDISTDNGKNWVSKNSGLPSLGIISMIINGEYVFVGIDNYGIFRAKLSDLGITDVKEPEQTNEIKIYPNPASDEFRLRFHSPIETTVQLNVFDLLGNCVLSQSLQSTEGTNEKTINCEKLPQGYYYVKININENVETVPLVLIK
ncbi:MAG: T9SS type A sorting domain-containing protein [Bacteroidetes bacterium]|nr:MAG: T9SS type A sorting domain-containing protein [Bacteroidota bacterium]